MRRALCVGLVLAGEAEASPTTVTAEGGAEVDTNVERIDSRPGNERTGAAVSRLGAKLDHRGKVLGGSYSVLLTGIARYVNTTGIALAESTALTIGDLRWMRSVGSRPVAVGVALSGADASGIGYSPFGDDDAGARAGSRTFRSVGVDGLVALRGGDNRTLSMSFGGRAFEYKPDADFNWAGPAATARLDVTLWEADGGTRNLEVAAFAGVEARAYESTAAVNVCPEDAMPEDPRDCSAGTTLPRRDRYHRFGVEVTWTGSVVAQIGYQLAVNDSNSFGQSLVRHRVNLSVTRDLPWKLYGSALAILQFDQYLDGLIVQEDLQNQTFTTLDDENRSSLQIRIARELSKSWSIESRGAIWRDLDSDPATSFRRAIIYLGVIFSR